MLLRGEREQHLRFVLAPGSCPSGYTKFGRSGAGGPPLPRPRYFFPLSLFSFLQPQPLVGRRVSGFLHNFFSVSFNFIPFPLFNIKAPS